MKPGYRYGMILLAGLVLAVLLQPIGCHHFERWFGPPSRELRESYPDKPDGPKVDHRLFERVLRDFVTDTGMVHYPKLVEHSADLDRYIAVLGTLDFTALGRNEKLALLINSYNAFTLRLIIDHWPVHSIQDIPAAERWDARRWRIGDLQLSLDEIEHDYLRKRFREPRIHFAINCASIGCPPLRVEPYRAERLERQLQEQAERMHRDPTWVELRDNRSTIRLTRLYQWFSGDFEQVSGSVLDFAARFLPDLAIEVEAGRRPTIEWIEYDWGINLAR